jgi:hypothetical protein
MSLYITAQLIGFLGFLLLTGAPYFKNKETFIKIDISACLFLFLQWLMLAQPGLAIMNILNITHSISVLKANNIIAKKMLPLFYPLSLAIFLLVLDTTTINALCIIGFLFLIKAKNSKDMVTFRSYALIATLALAYSGYLALSIPAMAFGTLRILIHSYRLAELLQFRKQDLKPVKIALI